jgi:hypothetical protein
MTGELAALTGTDAGTDGGLAGWEPTDPNGSTVTRMADDVDKVQARLARERAHRLAYRDRAETLAVELADARLRLRHKRGDAVLAFACGLLGGFSGLAVLLWYTVP